MTKNLQQASSGVSGGKGWTKIPSSTQPLSLFSVLSIGNFHLGLLFIHTSGCYNSQLQTLKWPSSKERVRVDKDYTHLTFLFSLFQEVDFRSLFTFHAKPSALWHLNLPQTEENQFPRLGLFPCTKHRIVRGFIGNEKRKVPDTSLTF